MSPVTVGNPSGLQAFAFADDGIVPNSALPALFYRGAIAFTESDADTAGEELDDAAQENGWHLSWTGSVYRRVHYHSNVHECLAVFCGEAEIELGGRRVGQVIAVKGGDALLIPAGVGHRRLSSSPDFTVFGLYPIGKDYDLCWDWAKLREQSRRRIRRVPLPASDPFFGENGPLFRYWKQ